MNTKNINLTMMEGTMLLAVQQGMDNPGDGWLHEITPFTNDHVGAGVLASLIKKGLVTSEKDDLYENCFWVSLTEAGANIKIEARYGGCNPWSDLDYRYCGFERICGRWVMEVA